MGTSRAVVIGVALLLCACSSRTVTVEPAGAPTPYGGPLVVDAAAAQNATERTTGAAGRVVQCRGGAEGGRNEGASYGGEVGSTPVQGLRTALDEGSAGGPEHGWRLERRDDDRALLTVVVGAERKAAAIVRHGPALGHQVGWYVESYAFCNLAEFPRPVATAAGVELWTDDRGRPVDTRTVTSRAGPEHCGWQRMTFLDVSGGSTPDHGGATYVRAVLRDYVGTYVAEPFRAAVPLPADVRDTGWSHDRRHLWLSADGRRAFVGSPDAATVELWPRTTQPLLCA